MKFSTKMQRDEYYMKRCFELALNGKGQVSPNPLVGCVIVYQNTIIGEGFHRVYGGPHAEPNAIASVKNQEWLKEATLYVNLEPCAHHGKTPPCADLIIRHQIPRVVISVKDPFPLVQGRGIDKLTQAGVEVTTGVLEKEGKFLNRRFLTFHRKQRPYIVLKWAQSADGFMDRNRTNDGQKAAQISNFTNQTLVHLWRSEEDGICVGRRTIEQDNPRLSVRNVTGKQPVRIVIGRNVKPEASAAVLDKSAMTFIFNLNREQDGENTNWIKLNDSDSFLKQVVNHLYQRGIQSILVEGGSHLHKSFINEGWWDEMRITQSNQTFGSGVQAPVVEKTASEVHPTGQGNRLAVIYRNSE